MQNTSPTSIRYQVIGSTTLAAIVMYLDRVCIAEIAKLQEFKEALSLTEEQMGAMYSAFFFTYALAQVPAGWLSDRFGARTMLPVYIGIWSLCTVLTGLANDFTMLITARLLFGIAQAGCFPTAGSLIRRWIPLPQRGTASSIVSFGGRLGGATAPILTAWLLSDVAGWREVLIAYGLTGLLISLLFWVIVRETPAEHPGCNDAERNLISLGLPPTQDSERPTFPPILPLLTSPAMWCMSFLQFGVNVGWVFLVTKLPAYLKDVFHVDPKTGGLMSSVILAAGIVGMLCGGRLTDLLTRQLGRRWGRSLQQMVCYVVAIAAYLTCPFLGPPEEGAVWIPFLPELSWSPWFFVGACALVAFATDMSVPAIWAYMQDVGGKNTAAAFGWGNMWGNLGAATTPLLIPLILEHWGWTEVFYLLAGGFLLSLICTLGINAERKLE